MFLFKNAIKFYFYKIPIFYIKITIVNKCKHEFKPSEIQ